MKNERERFKLDKMLLNGIHVSHGNLELRRSTQKVKGRDAWKARGSRDRQLRVEGEGGFLKEGFFEGTERKRI